MATNLTDQGDVFDIMPTTEEIAELTSVEMSEEEEPYCYCGEPNDDNMIWCDDPQCEYEWWHYDCAEVNEQAIPDGHWKCSQCMRSKELKVKKRKGPKSTSRPSKDLSVNKKDHKRKAIPAPINTVCELERSDGVIFSTALKNVLLSEVLELNEEMCTEIKQLVTTLLALDDTIVPASKAIVQKIKSISKTGQNFKKPRDLEDMWQNFHLLCISDDFEAQINRLVNLTGINIAEESGEFFSQLLADEILKEILTIKSVQTLKPTKQPERLSEKDEQVLRYVAGYIPFALLKHFRRYPNNSLSTACIVILESWRVPQDRTLRTFLLYTKHWLHEINRGHAFDVSDHVYLFFRCVERVVRPVLKQDNMTKIASINVKDHLMNNLLADTNVSVAWDSITTSVENDLVTDTLKKRVLTSYIKLRCTAFCKAYTILEKRVMTKKAGEKSLRKSVNKS